MNKPALLAGELPQRGLSHYHYSIYGLRIRTAIPLSIPELPEESAWDLDVLAGDPVFFEESLRHVPLKSDWAQAYRLPGRWFYARIEGALDFLINPDASQIFYRPLADFSQPSFETYLLGLLMKAVLIKRGIHSLHASAVVVDGKAIAFVGDSGFGKSSLAACFVNAGYPLLTDDILRLDEDDGRMWAYPGPTCLKLLPDARQALGGFREGIPMDPGADKWLFPVVADLRYHKRLPLGAIYCIVGPERARETRHIVIEEMERREALPEILYGTNIDRVVEPDRVTNPFEAAKRIIDAISIRRLSYPWELALLPDVRDAILAGLRKS